MADTGSMDEVEGKPRQRRRRGAGGAAAPVRDIRALIATIRAEHEAQLPADAPQTELHALMKQFIAAREQERARWQEERSAILAESEEMERRLRETLVEREEAADRHRQTLADLTLQHEHQRSIWLLERRRLEINLRALERRYQRRFLARILPARLRPAMAIGLLLMAVAGAALTSDSGAAILKGTVLNFIDPPSAQGASAVAQAG